MEELQIAQEVAKGTSPIKKKSRVTNRVQRPKAKGFMSREMFDYIAQEGCKEYGRGRLQGTKFRTDTEFVPIFFTELPFSSSSPMYEISKGAPSASKYDELYINTWRSCKPYVKHLRLCALMEDYFPIITANTISDITLSGDRLGRVIKTRYNDYVLANTACPSLPSSFLVTPGAVSSIIKHTKYGLKWRALSIGTGESRRVYASKFLSVFEIKVVERTTVYNALVSVVVRKELLPVIKAYMASNIPIPSKYMHLWIDKKFSEEQDNPLLVALQKGLISPLARAGVSLEYKDSLTSELITTMNRPNFSSMEEERAWKDSKLLEYYKFVDGSLTYGNAHFIEHPQLAGLASVGLFGKLPLQTELL